MTVTEQDIEHFRNLNSQVKSELSKLSVPDKVEIKEDELNTKLTLDWEDIEIPDASQLIKVRKRKH